MGRDDWDDGVVFEDAGPKTRPFVVTGGKTQTNASVRIEMLVESAGPNAKARFEKAELLKLASGKSISVAELSAHLKLPIGTTMTLVGEMLDEGLLSAHATVETDESTDVAANIDIMSRIIKRVQEL